MSDILATGNTPPEPLDYIYGAENIARFMKVNTRRVYYFVERAKIGKCSAPIHYRNGIGLYASAQALIDYLK